MSRKFIISEQERNNILKLHKLLNESYGDKVAFNNLEVGKYYALSSIPSRVSIWTIVFIKKIENEIGRTNTQFWAPREIDIDILAIDKIFYQSEELIIPHIGLFDRDFFVKTVCEIDEDYFLELKNHFKR